MTSPRKLAKAADEVAAESADKAGAALVHDSGGIDPKRHGRDFCLARLRDMLRIRRLEERSAQLYGEGKIRGFMHLYIGEEAVAAGVLPNLRPEDNLVTTYREHGQALLRGLSMKSIMAEMYGKVEGCSRGRGGSMHLFDRETRLFGGNAIVGGGLPLAVGLALADKLSATLPSGAGTGEGAAAGVDVGASAAAATEPAAGRDANAQRTTAASARRRCVTACFFGEGAVAEGAFHESLNLAALWRVPVLFICENNLYAMGTALSRSESQIDLTRKAASYGLRTGHVNGMNVLAVHEAARQVIDFVREQQSPFFLELHTYRFRAHSMFDAELYRDKAEVERWKKHGPIHTFTDRLKAAGLMTEDDFQRLDREAGQEVEEAVAFAEAGQWEAVENLCDDLIVRTDRKVA